MRRKTFLPLSFLLLIGFLTPLYSQIPLYISKQSGQSSEYHGSHSKTTDRYESGSVALSSNGPVTYTVSPGPISIGTNQTKGWDGTVKGNSTAAPAPGQSAAAQLIGNYNVTFSRPAGTGSGGTIQSTYSCTGCPAHTGSAGGSHEIINKTGTEVLDFIVYSIDPGIPDTICLAGAGGITASGDVTANGYPDPTGGTYAWTSLSPVITLSSNSGQTITVTLSDTNITTGSISVTYTLQGVSYTKNAVVKKCECQCKPITAGETFGPVAVTFTANPTSSSPDGQGFCTYNTGNAAFNLNMEGVVNKQAAITNATLTYKKNCKTGAFKDVQISWNGNADVGDIGFLSFKVTALNLGVDAGGNLSGSVTLNTRLNQDKDLSGNKGIILLKQGVNGDITFNFTAGNDWSGSFDFSGIKNINIDIKKQNTVIANFQNGALNANGDLSAQFSVVGGASYTTNAFRITMNTLTLGFEVKLTDPTTFRITNGNGSVAVDQMKGVTGSITLALAFSAGNCNATISASGIQAFTMTLQQLNLTVNFNADFDMTELDGSLLAKHNKFDAAIQVSQFNILNGELKKFQASGKVKYNGFTFQLINASYVPVELTITAKAEINITVSAAMAVDQFKIAQDGTITVGSIAGGFQKTPVNVTFSAAFQTNRFKGNFTADFAAIGLDGAIDIGAEPAYNFGYLAITAKTQIPLGNSGLKLTQIGGQAGFNYQLPSTPAQGNYVIGLTLGVADVANMCEVIGNPVIQLGSSSVTMTLNGTLNVLKNNPFFTGNLNVNYKIPAQTIDGSVGSVINIPSNGFVFKSNNLNINFNAGGGSWGASGSNMGGKMFNVVDFSNGSINMNGSLTPISLTGNLSGTASAGFSHNVHVSAAGNTVSGSIAINLNSNVNASIDQNGLAGSINANVTGLGDVNFDTWIYSSGPITTTGNGTGTITVNGNSASMSGNMTLNLPFNIPFWGSSVGIGFTISI